MHVIVGLSGGVDSALSAALLQEQGYRVSGIFMRNWHERDSHCTTTADEQSAQSVADHLKIPLHVVDFSQEYIDRVFRVMLDILAQGATPNPDILCNQEIKFRCLLHQAQRLQADFLATGHYAQICQSSSGACLAQAVDENKDQSYFLCCMPKNALTRVRFPLGKYTKVEVRQLAKARALPNALRKDSTGICFIGERRFDDFIAQHLLDRPGEIVDTAGRKLGMHRGIFYYTIGQRKGLQLGGHAAYAEKPWYVVAKDLSLRRLIVAQGDDHPALFSHSLRAVSARWFIDPPSTTCVLGARIRHRQAQQAITLSPDGPDWLVVFKTAQRAISPGQYIAFYQGNLCIGAAIIQQSHPS